MRTWLRRLLILALVVVGDPIPESLLAGSILILLGQILHFIAAGTLVKTEVLTIAGPYRWVRNPFYFSNLLTDAGFCVVAWNPWVPLVWFPYFYGFVIHPRTKSEEAELLEIHGKAYQDYLDRVPRYVPGLFPKYPHVRGALNWDALRRNREFPRQLRHWAFLLVLFAKDRLVTLQGGNRWSLEGLPKLREDIPAVVALGAGVAMILAPWVAKLIFGKKKKTGTHPAPAAQGPEPRP